MTIQRLKKEQLKASVLIIVGIAMIIMSLMITVYSINKGKNKTVKAEYTNKTMVSYDNLYLSEGTVICVNTDLDKVTVIDVDGEAYQFYGVEDWQVNDGCILLLDNNGTEDNKDDIIIDTLYDMR